MIPTTTNDSVPAEIINPLDKKVSVFENSWGTDPEDVTLRDILRLIKSDEESVNLYGYNEARGTIKYYGIFDKKINSLLQINSERRRYVTLCEQKIKNQFANDFGDIFGIKATEFDETQLDCIPTFDKESYSGKMGSDGKKKGGVKKTLPGFCISANFTKRNGNSIIGISGFIILDFDDIDIKHVAEFKEYVTQDQHTFACWYSPSFEGVKALVRIPEYTHQSSETTLATHKSYFYSIQKYWNLQFDNLKHCLILNSKTLKEGILIDPSGDDITRVCYFNLDSNLYQNEDAKIWTKQEAHKVYKRQSTFTSNVIGDINYPSQCCYKYEKGNSYKRSFLLANTISYHFGEEGYDLYRHILRDFPDEGLDSYWKSALRNNPSPSENVEKFLKKCGILKQEKKVETNPLMHPISEPDYVEPIVIQDYRKPHKPLNPISYRINGVEIDLDAISEEVIKQRKLDDKNNKVYEPRYKTENGIEILMTRQEIEQENQLVKLLGEVSFMKHKYTNSKPREVLDEPISIRGRDPNYIHIECVLKYLHDNNIKRALLISPPGTGKTHSAHAFLAQNKKGKTLVLTAFKDDVEIAQRYHINNGTPTGIIDFKSGEIEKLSREPTNTYMVWDCLPSRKQKLNNFANIICDESHIMIEASDYRQKVASLITTLDPYEGILLYTTATPLKEVSAHRMNDFVVIEAYKTPEFINTVEIISFEGSRSKKNVALIHIIEKKLLKGERVIIPVNIGYETRLFIIQQLKMHNSNLVVNWTSVSKKNMDDPKMFDTIYANKYWGEYNVVFLTDCFSVGKDILDSRPTTYLFSDVFYDKITSGTIRQTSGRTRNGKVNIVLVGLKTTHYTESELMEQVKKLKPIIVGRKNEHLIFNIKTNLDDTDIRKLHLLLEEKSRGKLTANEQNIIQELQSTNNFDIKMVNIETYIDDQEQFDLFIPVLKYEWDINTQQIQYARFKRWVNFASIKYGLGNKQTEINVENNETKNYCKVNEDDTLAIIQVSSNYTEVIAHFDRNHKNIDLVHGWERYTKTIGSNHLKLNHTETLDDIAINKARYNDYKTLVLKSFADVVRNSQEMEATLDVFYEGDTITNKKGNVLTQAFSPVWEKAYSYCVALFTIQREDLETFDKKLEWYKTRKQKRTEFEEVYHKDMSEDEVKVIVNSFSLTKRGYTKKYIIDCLMGRDWGGVIEGEKPDDFNKLFVDKIFERLFYSTVYDSYLVEKDEMSLPKRDGTGKLVEGGEYIRTREIKEMCYFLKREYLIDTNFVVPQSPHKEIDQTKEKYSHIPNRYFNTKKNRVIDVMGEVVELNNTYKTCTSFQQKVKTLFKANKNKITTPQINELFVEFDVDVVAGRMLKKMLSEILGVGIDSYEVTKSAERYYVYTKQK